MKSIPRSLLLEDFRRLPMDEANQLEDPGGLGCVEISNAGGGRISVFVEGGTLRPPMYVRPRFERRAAPVSGGAK